MKIKLVFLAYFMKQNIPINGWARSSDIAQKIELKWGANCYAQFASVNKVYQSIKKCFHSGLMIDILTKF